MAKKLIYVTVNKHATTHEQKKKKKIGVLEVRYYCNKSVSLYIDVYKHNNTNNNNNNTNNNNNNTTLVEELTTTTMNTSNNSSTNNTNNNNTTSNNMLIVANDLLSAIEYCGISRDGTIQSKNISLCDIQLIGQNGNCIVHACRFILASRSSVFYRMLYGNYREAKSQSIALLCYNEIILHCIVYFCSYNTIHPSFPTSIEYIHIQIQLLQAADYLQLNDLCILITNTIIIKHMSIQPQYNVVTYIYEHVPITSNLYNIAIQMIQLRPYIILDPYNTYSKHIHMILNNNNNNKDGLKGDVDGNNENNHNENDVNDHENDNENDGLYTLSIDKLELIYQMKHMINASEFFLFYTLLRWYTYHKQQFEKQLFTLTTTTTTTGTSLPDTTTNTNIAIQEDIDLLTKNVKKICKQYIQLSHIEPQQLLYYINHYYNSNTTNNNTNSNNTTNITNNDISCIVSSQEIYNAITQQAINASIHKTWYLPYSNGTICTTITTTTTNDDDVVDTTNNTTTTNTNNNNNHNDTSASSITTTTRTTTIIPDRVLVEGAGHHDANGIYYRINTNSSSSNNNSNTNHHHRSSITRSSSSVTSSSVRSSSRNSRKSRSHNNNNNNYLSSHGTTNSSNQVKNVLYTKREIMVGQQNVYTLSRCLRYRPKSKKQPNVNASVLDVDVEDDADDDDEDDDTNEMYYECRIFSSPFLTYRSVRQLQMMQITTTIIPCYQPVMQLIEWSSPANATSTSTTNTKKYNKSSSLSSTDNNTPIIRSTDNSGAQSMFIPPSSIRTQFSSFFSNTDDGHRSNSSNNNSFPSSDLFNLNNSNNMNIPTPIRKYYRVRLSDGEYHMPGTLAPELNGLIERNELDVNRVIQVLEFGVYTIHGCASIHVIKAVVVTGSTTPVHIFGNPTPLEDAEPIDSQNIPITTNIDDINSHTNHFSSNTNSTSSNSGRLQNLYRAEVVVHNKDELNNGTTPTESTSFFASGCIPKTGWVLDDHGIGPAPECTWIPSSSTTTSTTNSSNNNKSSTTSSKVATTTTAMSSPSSSPNGNAEQFNVPNDNDQNNTNNIIQGISSLHIE